MDDRELDARLSMIESGLRAVFEKVEGIEAVIQQYWNDFTEDKSALDEEIKETKKKIKIEPKDNGEQK